MTICRASAPQGIRLWLPLIGKPRGCLYTQQIKHITYPDHRKRIGDALKTRGYSYAVVSP